MYWIHSCLFGLMLTGCGLNGQHDCPFPDIDHDPTDRCGYVEVPLDYDEPDGPFTRIAYLVIPASGKRSKPDPVVFLQGGPGGSVLDYQEGYRQLRLDSERDFILYDQRGVGRSDVICPDLTPQLMQALAADLQPGTEAAFLAKAIHECQVSLQRAGKSPNDYHTLASVRDLEQLRIHLGYERWNIFGGSYGTRLGLSYVQTYPQSCRSQILVGIFPPQVRMYEHLLSNFEASLQLLTQTCAASTSCRTRYPDLGAMIRQNYRELEATPWTFSYSGENFTLNAADYLLLIQQMLYDRSTITRLPSLMEAISQRKAGQMTHFLGAMSQRLSAINLGIYWSVMTADEGTYPNQQWLEKELQETDFRDGLSLFTADPGIMRNWQQDETFATNLPETRSDKPMLLISGAFDPITPPAYAKKALAGLPNAQWAVFPNDGHTPLNACFFSLAARFLDAPDQPLEMDCVGATPPIQFR